MTSDTPSQAVRVGAVLDQDRVAAWPPLKHALWMVVTGEKLNDGHYINAYQLTDKLYDAALSASPPAEALPAGVEPVMWQVRMRPTWDAAAPWSPWRECTKECAERIASRSLSGDWEYEARSGPRRPHLCPSAGGSDVSQLPDGYSLEQDQDGDWILIGPPDVVLFSEPGEGLLIGTCDYETALADALAALKDTRP